MVNDMINVKLGRKLESEQLVDILEKAARDMGWKPGKHPVMQRGYVLGSVEKRDFVSYEKLLLRGRLFSHMSILGVYSGPTDEMRIYPSDFLSEGLIRKYLGRVSQYISELP